METRQRQLFGMPNHALVSMASVVVLAWSMVACGGSCPESPCDSGEVCRQGLCIESSEPPSSSGCPQTCPLGTTCREGRCVGDFPEPDAGSGGGGRRDRCTEAGQECDPYASPGEEFLCVPWEGTVESARCAPICQSTGGCSAGSACLPIQSSGGSASCRSSDECRGRRRCIQGQCLYSVCRPSECEGFSVGDSTCTESYSQRQQFEHGGRCLEVRNEAKFCVPAGPKEEGESCTTLARATQSQNVETVCKPGLACVSGTCRTVCESEGGCSGGRTCVGLESETVRAGLGQCIDACRVGASDCGDGETCRPVDGRRGRCVPAGDTEAFESCQPGAGDCREGLACIVYQEANPQIGRQQRARCHPLCDLSAGEADEDGTVTDEAQSRRDATCPQPDPAPASIRFVHLADNLGPVDLYRSGVDQPIAENVAVGSSTSGASGLYLSLEAGKYDFSLLPSDAPSTDLPVAEWSASLSAGQGAIFTSVPDPSSSTPRADMETLSPVDSSPSQQGRIRVRAAHLVDDVSRLDVVATPPDRDPGDSDAVELGASLSFGETSTGAVLETGTWDLYLFESDTSDRTGDRALAHTEDVSLDGDRTLFWHGTRDPADRQPTDQLAVLEAAPLPEAESQKPRLTCMEARSGGFGYCRQVCSEGADDYGSDRCEGDGMGCRPIRREALGEWDHLCTPVGEASVGEPCNPDARVGACGPGAYCLEYGNTRKGYDGGAKRGLCHSYCATDSSGASTPSCPGGESCRPISYRESVGIGRCQIPCEPNDQFRDREACPKGLQSCRPAASLQGPVGEGGSTPVVQRETSFCSASGDKTAGETCRGNNCRPTSACLFARSQEQALTRAILSHYYPSGSAPTCQKRCDPFDGDDAAARCESDETCLFNYPISGEVGHCADKTASKSPGEPCDRPGLACGEDSICATRQGRTRCLRFCDYEGPGTDGQPTRSTCPAGYVCAPFARDVGLCQRPR